MEFLLASNDRYRKQVYLLPAFAAREGTKSLLGILHVTRFESQGFFATIV
jgi:hypothetical protein